MNKINKKLLKMVAISKGSAGRKRNYSNLKKKDDRSSMKNVGRNLKSCFKNKIILN